MKNTSLRFSFLLLDNWIFLISLKIFPRYLIYQTISIYLYCIDTKIIKLNILNAKFVKWKMFLLYLWGGGISFNLGDSLFISFGGSQHPRSSMFADRPRAQGHSVGWGWESIAPQVKSFAPLEKFAPWRGWWEGSISPNFVPLKFQFPPSRTLP